MRRSDSVENGPDTMAYNTFGWTLVASTKQISPSSHSQSTPCFAGTKMRINATSIYGMFRQASGKQAIVRRVYLEISLSGKQVVQTRLDASRASCAGFSRILLQRRQATGR